MYILPLMFDRPEKLRIDESVELTEKCMFYPSQYVRQIIECRE